jgi:hypothetical protein
MAKTTKKTGKRKPSTPRTTSAPKGAVLVRTYSAGVHYGTLVKRDGREVTLKDARRCFFWQVDHVKHGNRQNSCSELAAFGPARDSKIAARVSTHVLLDAIEILDVSAEAAGAFDRWPA